METEGIFNQNFSTVKWFLSFLNSLAFLEDIILQLFASIYSQTIACKRDRSISVAIFMLVIVLLFEIGKAK